MKFNPRPTTLNAAWRHAKGEEIAQGVESQNDKN